MRARPATAGRLVKIYNRNAASETKNITPKTIGAATGRGAERGRWPEAKPREQN
jgi:hypothetical protein